METYTAFEKLALQAIITEELNLPNDATDFDKVKAVIDRFTEEYYNKSNGQLRQANIHDTHPIQRCYFLKIPHATDG